MNITSSGSTATSPTSMMTTYTVSNCENSREAAEARTEPHLKIKRRVKRRKISRTGPSTPPGPISSPRTAWPSPAPSCFHSTRESTRSPCKGARPRASRAITRTPATRASGSPAVSRRTPRSPVTRARIPRSPTPRERSPRISSSRSRPTSNPPARRLDLA